MRTRTKFTAWQLHQLEAKWVWFHLKVHATHPILCRSKKEWYVQSFSMVILLRSMFRFQQTLYLTRPERAQIASILCLSETQVMPLSNCCNSNFFPGESLVPKSTAQVQEKCLWMVVICQGNANVNYRHLVWHLFYIPISPEHKTSVLGSSTDVMICSIKYCHNVWSIYKHIDAI